MSGPKYSYVGKLLLALPLLLLWTGTASAYIGPGAGLELVAYSLGLLAWIVTMFSAILLWPIYAFLRWLRGSKDKGITAIPTDAAEGEAAIQETNPESAAAPGPATFQNQTLPSATASPMTAPPLAIFPEERRDNGQANP